MTTSSPSFVSKIDLTLLKKLVSELEAMVATCAALPTDSKENTNDAIIELAKASGIAANISQEAAFLTKDLYAVITSITAITSLNKAAYSSEEQAFLDILGSAIKAPPKDHGGRN
jgi:hypothetical protein